MVRTIILGTVLLVISAYSCKTNKETKTTKETAPKSLVICDEIIMDNSYYPYDEKPTYKISRAEVNDNKLYLTIHYLGGCGTHQFQLYGNTNYLKTKPVQLNLFLKHSQEHESCQKELVLEKCFDISAIKGLGDDIVRLNIRPYKEPVDYDWR